MKAPKKIKSIREFFWPILDTLETCDFIAKDLTDCKFTDSEIDLELKYIEDYKNSEDNRRKEVESKATIFIGTFGVATTVLINLAKDFILNTNMKISFLNLIVIVLISCTVIYLCQAIHFAIKALKRRNYSSIAFPKYMFTECEDKKKRLLIDQYNCVTKNREQINIKVDYVTMAQDYFIRAILIVAIITIMLLVKYISSYSDLLGSLNNIISKITITQAMMIGIVTVGVFLLAMIFILFKKVKKLEKQIMNGKKSVDEHNNYVLDIVKKDRKKEQND